MATRCPSTSKMWSTSPASAGASAHGVQARASSGSPPTRAARSRWRSCAVPSIARTPPEGCSMVRTRPRAHPRRAHVSFGPFPDISSMERYSSRSDGVHDERRMRFEELFRSHADAVRSYALRRTDPDEADDVVGETFLIAWRRLDDIPADTGPWLLGVARRVLSNRRRSDDRVLSLSNRLAERERRKPSIATDDTDLRLTVEAAL